MCCNHRIKSPSAARNVSIHYQPLILQIENEAKKVHAKVTQLAGMDMKSNPCLFAASLEIFLYLL
jgi:hypothetical protein